MCYAFQIGKSYNSYKLENKLDRKHILIKMFSIQIKKNP